MCLSRRAVARIAPRHSLNLPLLQNRRRVLARGVADAKLRRAKLYGGKPSRRSRPVRRFEIGGIQRATHPVTGDQLVHPGEAIEVVAVKLTWCRRSNCRETALGAACEHGPVWGLSGITRIGSR